MHVQSHLMSGWCVSNLFRLTPEERLFAMVAASAADLDGLSILFGQDAYWDYHHKIAHNLPLALLVAIALTLFSRHRLKAFLLYLGLFHLHLVLDYFGSGPGWPIYYFWPFSQWAVLNPRAWNFYSWQNITAAVLFLAWTIAIAVYCGRTPLEAIMPRLDRQLVAWLRHRLGWCRADQVTTENAMEEQ